MPSSYTQPAPSKIPVIRANQLIPTAVNKTWGPNAAANATFGQAITSQASRQFQVAARLVF